MHALSENGKIPGIAWLVALLSTFYLASLLHRSFQDENTICDLYAQNAIEICTLVYQIEVQTQIKVQVGEFPKINKRAVQNKCAGETSCKKLSNEPDLIDVQ